VLGVAHEHAQKRRDLNLKEAHVERAEVRLEAVELASPMIQWAASYAGSKPLTRTQEHRAVTGGRAMRRAIPFRAKGRGALPSLDLVRNHHAQVGPFSPVRLGTASYYRFDAACDRHLVSPVLQRPRPARCWFVAFHRSLLWAGCCGTPSTSASEYMTHNFFR